MFFTTQLLPTITKQLLPKFILDKNNISEADCFEKSEHPYLRENDVNIF